MPARSNKGSGGSSGSGSPSVCTESDLHDSGCKERVGNWAMDTLSDTWDNCPLVRERLRQGHNLFMNFDVDKHEATDQYVDKTIASLKTNHFVLSPVFKLMAMNDRTLPNLDRVMQQIAKLFDRSKLNLGEKRGDKVYQDAWALRRLCGVGKKETYRTSAPKDLFEGDLYRDHAQVYIYIYTRKLTRFKTIYSVVFHVLPIDEMK